MFKTIYSKGNFNDATKILVQINNLHTIEQMKENIKKPIFISSQILGTMVLFHLIKEKKLSKKERKQHLQCMKK
jgi:hypothetical protein